jgi:hypothetical protein
MDLSRFLRVAWRFKLLLAIGLVLATMAAVLSVFQIGAGGLSYREPPVYTSASTLFVTQDGFPWGRAILDDVIKVENGTANPTVVPRFGDPGRYSGLAALYAELAKGDAVRKEALKGAPLGAYYEPIVAQTPGAAAALPLIYMQGFGASPAAARDMANRASAAVMDYLERQQSASDIDEGKRVEVTVTQEAEKAAVYQGRSFVRPIFLFMLVSLVFVALAFGLENLRPRRQPPRIARPEDGRWPMSASDDSQSAGPRAA